RGLPLRSGTCRSSCQCLCPSTCKSLAPLALSYRLDRPGRYDACEKSRWLAPKRVVAETARRALSTDRALVRDVERSDVGAEARVVQRRLTGPFCGVIDGDSIP